MKKIISLMLALCLLALCGAAMAEDYSIEWSDVSSLVEKNGWEGQWVTSEHWDVGFFLPSFMQEVEIEEDGVLAAYASEDGAWVVTILEMNLTENGEEIDARECVAELQNEGYEDAEIAKVNGYSMIGYTDMDNDQMVLISLYDEGQALMYVYTPYSDDEFRAIARVMASSLMTYDEAQAMKAE